MDDAGRSMDRMAIGLARAGDDPLQRLRSCLEMLAMDAADRPGALGLIARARESHDRLRDLFGDLRALASPIRLECGTFDLPSVWREAWAHLEPSRRGRRATLDERLEPGDLRCRLDPFRMVSAFRHLFDRSLNAADPVAIRIGCAEATLGGRPALRVAIRDDGPAPDAGRAGSFFEPFGEAGGGGPGLGMAIARRVVEAHGGRLELAEAAGEGVELLMTLPREASP